MRVARLGGEVVDVIRMQLEGRFEAPTKPHFDRKTAAFFRDRLKKANLYLEFGSGGSTVWADKGGVETISIEGDLFYANVVRSVLSPDTKVTILTPDLGITGGWSTPIFPARVKGHRYIRAALDALGERTPDLALIDGRYRIACMIAVGLHARKTGKTTTVVFDDYGDRPQYHVVTRWFGKPARVGRSAVFEVGTQEVPRGMLQRFFGFQP